MTINGVFSRIGAVAVAGMLAVLLIVLSGCISTQTAVADVSPISTVTIDVTNLTGGSVAFYNGTHRFATVSGGEACVVIPKSIVDNQPHRISVQPMGEPAIGLTFDLNAAEGWVLRLGNSPNQRIYDVLGIMPAPRCN